MKRFSRSKKRAAFSATSRNTAGGKKWAAEACRKLAAHRAARRGFTVHNTSESRKT
jgi:hypothetical protein